MTKCQTHERAEDLFHQILSTINHKPAWLQVSIFWFFYTVLLCTSLLRHTVRRFLNEPSELVRQWTQCQLYLQPGLNIDEKFLVLYRDTEAHSSRVTVVSGGMLGVFSFWVGIALVTELIICRQGAVGTSLPMQGILAKACWMQQ